MFRSQIIAIGIALITIVVLFKLPKAIINKTDKNKLAEKPHNNTGAIDDVIAQSTKSISQSDFQKIALLRKNFYDVAVKEKRYIFADSLAILFASYDRLDSAAYYADELVLLSSDNQSLIKAGNIYFNIYSSVTDPTVANRFAAKAQEYYTKVLNSDPDNMAVKSNLAMTYVTSENPMQAISLLREILAKDPKNEAALFNLGLLSIQSGQFDKAIERFKNLVETNQNNWKAHLYLGIAQGEAGKHDLAAKEFELVVKKSNDSQLKAEALKYLGQKN